MTAEKFSEILTGIDPESIPYDTGLWEIFRDGRIYLCADYAPNDDGKKVFTFAIFTDKNPDEIFDVAGQYIFQNGAIVGADGVSSPAKELLEAWQRAEKADA